MTVAAGVAAFGYAVCALPDLFRGDDSEGE